MPTLPIGATAVEPWLFLWRNAGGLMRLFAPWLAGIAVVIPVADALAGPAAGAAFDNLCALYSMVAVALAAVACHRAALLGATLGLGASLRLRQREVQYLGLVALTYVVGMGFDAAYDWTWAHDPLMRLLRAIGVLWLLDAIGLHAVGVYLRLWPWFAVTALSALLWLRLAPMFPAIAVDDARTGFIAAWWYTRGNTLRLAAANVLLLAPLVAAGFAYVALAGTTEAEPAAAPAPRGVVYAVVDLFGDLTFGALEAVFLSVIYRRLSAPPHIQNPT